MKQYLGTSHQPLATKRAAFTLIELLVVITVITVLLTLLVPALQRARSQARTVMCRSNLRQFGSVLSMYVEDSAGRLPVGHGNAIWLLRGSSPGEQQDPNVPKVSQSVRVARAACCPMAVKAANRGTFSTRSRSNDNVIWHLKGTSGSEFGAWTITSPGPVFRASYGFNFLPFGEQGGGGFFPGERWPRSMSRGLNVFTVAGRSEVPILLDSTRMGNHGSRAVGIPSERPGSGRGMPFCINRHNGRVNALFLDWSVRAVGLKELWTLKWCPDFDTAGPWTLAGGVQPEDWPEWMRGFKDY